MKVTLYDELYESMRRRIRVMRRNNHADFRIEYAIWIAIQTYAVTPGRDRLSRDEAEKLFEALGPAMKEIPDGRSVARQDPCDRALMDAEKDRRRAAFRATGLEMTGQYGERL